MSKQNFNWKSLFVNEEQNTSKESTVGNSIVEKKVDNKFPDNITLNNTQSEYNNPFISEILQTYEKGFDSLNLSDFDFFELYKSVLAVGVTNPQSYQMAFTLGKTIKPDLTKEYLLEKSKFYIDEIGKVYSKYDSTGNGKKKDLEKSISNQKTELTSSISDIETKIAQLQNELKIKNYELSKIDGNNLQQFTELQMKIDANNIAKKKILESIDIVVSGINQYL